MRRKDSSVVLRSPWFRSSVLAAGLVSSLVTVPLSAQSAAQRLAAAVVIEEQEHDLDRALSRYRALGDELAQDGARDVAAAAWLRAGKLERELGREARARESFDRAVALGGASGAAAAALRGQDPQDPKRLAALRKQAEQAIERLRHEAQSSLKMLEAAAARDLLWIGEPAVAAIVAELRGRIGDAQAITWKKSRLDRALSALIWAIGGTEARAFLDWARAQDGLGTRRVAAVGALHATSDTAPALEAFLADADDEAIVHQLLLTWQAGRSRGSVPPQLRFVRAAALIDLANSGPSQARALALSTLAQHWSNIVHDPDSSATVRGLAPVLRRAFGGADPVVGQAAENLLRRGWIMFAADEGVRLLLDVWPSLADGFSFNGGPSGDFVLPDGAAYAKRIVALATAPQPGGETSKKSSLRLLTIDWILPQWDESAFDQVLALASAPGFGDDRVFAWIRRHAQPEAAPAILRSLTTAPQLDNVIDWLTSHDQDPALWPTLRATAERIDPRQLENQWGFAIAAARTGHPDIGKWLAAGLETWGADGYITVANAAVAWSRRVDVEASRAMLRELAVRRNRSEDNENNAELSRNRVLARLLELGDEPTLELLPRVLDAGLRFGPAGLRQRLPEGVGLDWLGEIELEEGRIGTWHGYDASTWRATWSQLLRAQRPEAWARAHLLLGRSTGAHSPIRTSASAPNERYWRVHRIAFGRPRPEVIGMLADAVGHVLSVTNDSRATHSALFNLLLMLSDSEEIPLDAAMRGRLEALRLRATEHGDAVTRRIGLDRIPDEPSEDERAVLLRLVDDADKKNADAAWDRLAERSPDEAMLEAMMTTRYAHLRTRAIQIVAPRLRVAAVPVVAKRLRDESGQVRVAACKFLGLMVQQDSVPMLLEALTDANVEVRDQAEWALNAIRFYHEQKAHWDRVFAGTSVSTGGAAAALLAQAAAEQPRDVRTLAIRSLGALGAPETLPFLIDLTRDADPDITAAARAAIEAIHAKK